MITPCNKRNMNDISDPGDLEVSAIDDLENIISNLEVSIIRFVFDGLCNYIIMISGDHSRSCNIATSNHARKEKEGYRDMFELWRSWTQ
jgi:arginase family enzyme